MKQWKFNSIDGEIEKSVFAESKEEAVMIFLDVMLSQNLTGFQIKEGATTFKRHPELMSFFNIIEVLP